MNGKIYMIRNEVNGKRYIGQTVNSLEERFKQHKQGTRQPKKNMTKLQRAMDKYGKPMFTITLIEDHIETIELLAEREKFFIEKFNTKEEYNSTSGGENRLRTKTVKDDITNSNYFVFSFSKASTACTRSAHSRRFFWISQPTSYGLRISPWKRSAFAWQPPLQKKRDQQSRHFGLLSTCDSRKYCGSS